MGVRTVRTDTFALKSRGIERRSFGRGFGLIPVLVVLAIIALLVALVLPAR
jgi:prepilin-type N-terminal cleavage/methylation domain-containing protein